MDKTPKIYMAVIGCLPENTDSIRQVLRQMDDSFTAAFGCRTKTEWLLSPAFSDIGWLSFADACGVECHIVRTEDDTAWANAGKTQTVAEARLRSFEEQWLSANADVTLIVWNEQAGEMDGAVFEMLSRAHRDRLPCVWFSTVTGKTYWPMENYYELFNPEDFVPLLKRLYALAPEQEKPDENQYKRLLKLGASLQARFFRKHTPPRKAGPPTCDPVLEEGAKQENTVAAKLTALFQKYDQEAIRCGDKYHAIMYYRAILPAIAALCLAVGFYAADFTGMIRTVAGWLPSSWLPAAGRLAQWTPPAGLETALHCVSGIGFLLNALILYYAYKMSEAGVIKYWHARYVTSRQIAETYRVLLHFQPQGICIDLKSVCGRNLHILATVREELRAIGLSSCVIDEQSMDGMLDGVEAMLEDQVSYQERGIQRYEAITGLLLRRAETLKRVSLFVLIGRGLMQFFIGVGMLGQGDKTGTIANMFAMLLPAYAAYYTSKNDQCKYGFYLENHRRMKKSISDALLRIREIRESVGHPSVEMLVSISETLSQLMILDDTANWYEQISKTSFTQL